MDQALINKFHREHGDQMRRVYWNHVQLNANMKFKHYEFVRKICEHVFWELGMNFATEYYSKYKNRFDIVVPELPKPFIEIMYSEKPNQMSAKLSKLPKELRSQVIIFDAKYGTFEAKELL